MLNRFLKSEMDALLAARQQLANSRRNVSSTRQNLMETTEDCLTEPMVLTGIFLGGFASGSLGTSGEKSERRGILSGVKLSIITQLINSYFNDRKTEAMDTQAGQ